MNKIFLYLLYLVFFFGSQTAFAVAVCHPLLWPASSFSRNLYSDQQRAAIEDIHKSAVRQLKAIPQPISTLASAGKIDKNNPIFLATRRAYADADRAVVLAFAFTVMHDPDYLAKAREILLKWASVNQPTGNPIDETRLEGMIWAYDLISCQLSVNDQYQIRNWFAKLREKKIAWKFGSITNNNNHRIHQMKMLLLLDKVLHDTNAWTADLIQANKYAQVNLDKNTGESLDYLQRNALYYHNFDLQAWLEINLVSGCCRESIVPAFDFLSQRILSHHITGEFINSTAQIDKLRDKAGFSYAHKGGSFDVSRAAPTVVSYYTLVDDMPVPELWDIVQTAKPSLWLTFVKARRVFWI